MKTIFYLFLLTVGIGVARAQDATYAAGQPADYQPAAVPIVVPTVVYQAPVVYLAPVVYQGPVAYYAPVVYAPPVVACAPAPACDEWANRSTVTYIGGGHVGYRVAGNNCGSTVTYIGGGSR